MKFIDLQCQYAAYRDEIDARVQTVLEHTQFVMGPEIEEFEQKLAERVGVKHVVTTSSGTTSLEIALRALEIGSGDEVITPPFSFVASTEVVRLVGATPVFVDIEEHSFNIDPTAIESAITDKTKAVIAVDLFGQMADYTRLNEIAEKRPVTVIEDAAQSFGAVQDGRASGGASEIGSTSFFPTKTLSCFGDGGALFTNDDHRAERIRNLRLHGGERADYRYVGTNGRFDTLQAAVLLAKLPHLDDELEVRRRLAGKYSEALGDVCVVPEVSEGNTHVFTPYTVRVCKRNEVRIMLRRAGIPSAIYYPRCLHQQPAYADFGSVGDFPVAEQAAREVLSLPLHPFLRESDQDFVISELRAIIKNLAVGLDGSAVVESGSLDQGSTDPT